jgi:hypothetical protein
MTSRNIEIEHATHTHVKVSIDQHRKQATVSLYPVTLKVDEYGTSETVNISVAAWPDFMKTLEPMPRRNKKRLEQLLEEQIKKIETKDERSEAYQLFQKCLTL